MTHTDQLRLAPSTGLRLVGWLAVLALVGLALLGPGTASVLGSSVTPTHPQGNPTCSELNSSWTLFFKIDTGQLEEKTYQSGDQHVETNWTGQTITITDLTNGGQTFSWSSTLPVSGVLVKAGNDNNALYTYEPPVTGDTNLTHGPGQQGISHVLFCGTSESPTPTPTPTTTVTPTPTPTPTATGEVLAATGTPRVTPPATDTATVASAPSSTAWRVAILGLAAAIALTLVLTPATDRRRRR